MVFYQIAKKKFSNMFSNLYLIAVLMIAHVFQIVILHNSFENFIGSSLADTHYFVQLSVINQNYTVGSLTFYTSATLAQLLLILVVVAVEINISEKENRTFQRLLTAPIKKKSIILGYFSGYFSAFALAAFIFMLLTYFFLGIAWHHAITGILALTLVVCFFASSLALAISSLFHNSKVATTISSFFIVIMAFISGAVSAGTQYSAISRFTVNRWIFDAYIHIFDNNALVEVTPTILTLFLLIIVFSIITWIFFTRSKAYE